jgi:hypothetical protein
MILSKETAEQINNMAPKPTFNHNPSEMHKTNRSKNITV